MSIYHDLEAIKAIAIHKSKEYNCNYNVIIANPLDGQFNIEHGSTYEFVTDSYLVNRPDTIIVFKTNEDLNKTQIILVMDQSNSMGAFTKQIANKLRLASIGIGGLGISAHINHHSMAMQAAVEFRHNALNKLPEIAAIDLPRITEFHTTLAPIYPPKSLLADDMMKLGGSLHPPFESKVLTRTNTGKFTPKKPKRKR